ncbi:MAG: chorismate mutase [Candidatus Dormiibacterota bacterium]
MSAGLGGEGDRPGAELTALRERLDAIDRQLLTDLADRFRVTREVGSVKATARLPAFDARREEAVLDRLVELDEAQGLDPWLIRRVYRLIFDTVVAEHRAQQGEPGPRVP